MSFGLKGRLAVACYGHLRRRCDRDETDGFRPLRRWL